MKMDAEVPFENVYTYTLDEGDFWTINQESSFFEFQFNNNYIIKITHYSFITYNGGPLKHSECGPVDWSINYIYDDQTKKEEYHSDETNVYNTEFNFIVSPIESYIIKRLRFTMHGTSSRGHDYHLALRIFEIYGSLFRNDIQISNKFFNLQISHFLFIFLLK